MVLVSIGTDQMYSLNATGAAFWELAAAGLSQEAICQELLSRYDVDEEVLRAEIQSLAEQLTQEKLLASPDEA